MELDLLIVGAGPAGVACALQAHRDGLALAIVSDEPVGGLLATARRLDNLPGLAGISGPALAARLAGDLAGRGIAVTPGRVASLSAADRGRFTALLADGTRHRAAAVCLATGTRPVPLPPWSEGALAERPGRLAREARALPESLAGSRVVVIGGGEAALDSALWARDRGAAVELLARGPSLRAPARLVAEARQAGVRLRTGTEVVGCGADPAREGWELACRDGGLLPADWLVVCIGRTPRGELCEGVAGPGGTPPGVFLAGDVQNGQGRYAALALGDGVRAAIAARGHLEAGR